MPEEQKSILTPVLVGALVVAAFLIGVLFTKVQTLEKNDGTVAGKETQATASPAPQTQQELTGPAAVQPTLTGVTTFSEKKDAQICTEDGKPVVYLFSTTWCPHCTWIKETFDTTVQEYVNAGKIKAYHWEIDTYDNTLTATAETEVPAEHMAVYNEFNPQGSIPTFVFGCKYFRVGNGHEQKDDLAAEAAEFRSVIDGLIQ